MLMSAPGGGGGGGASPVVPDASGSGARGERGRYAPPTVFNSESPLAAWYMMSSKMHEQGRRLVAAAVRTRMPSAMAAGHGDWDQGRVPSTAVALQRLQLLDKVEKEETERINSGRAPTSLYLRNVQAMMVAQQLVEEEEMASRVARARRQLDSALKHLTRSQRLMARNQSAAQAILPAVLSSTATTASPSPSSPSPTAAAAAATIARSTPRTSPRVSPRAKLAGAAAPPATMTTTTTATTGASPSATHLLRASPSSTFGVTVPRPASPAAAVMLTMNRDERIHYRTDRMGKDRRREHIERERARDLSRSRKLHERHFPEARDPATEAATGVVEGDADTDDARPRSPPRGEATASATHVPQPPSSRRPAGAAPHAHQSPRARAAARVAAARGSASVAVLAHSASSGTSAGAGLGSLPTPAASLASPGLAGGAQIRVGVRLRDLARSPPHFRFETPSPGALDREAEAIRGGRSGGDEDEDEDIPPPWEEYKRLMGLGTGAGEDGVGLVRPTAVRAETGHSLRAVVIATPARATRDVSAVLQLLHGPREDEPDEELGEVGGGGPRSHPRTFSSSSSMLV